MPTASFRCASAYTKWGGTKAAVLGWRSPSALSSVTVDVYGLSRHPALAALSFLLCKPKSKDDMTRPFRAVLVEDNPGDVDLTRETLEASKLKIDISVAIDGVQALAMLRRQGEFEGGDLPDLILLDLNLPKLGGREVLAAIKQDTLLHTIPVVILTSSDAEQDILKSYELGANCYVTKPVGLQAFQSIVRSVENFWFSVVKLS